MRDTRVEDIMFTLSGKEQQWKGGMLSMMNTWWSVKR